MSGVQTRGGCPARVCPVGPVPVRLAGGARLTRDEVFDACQVLADAGRTLVGSGAAVEADALARLFVLLEARVTRPGPTGPPGPGLGPGG